MHKPRIKAALAFITLALLIGAGCGKRKPPLPPKERIVQRVEVTGFQRGSDVIVSWQMPARNAGPGSVLNVARVDIYRLAEPLSAPQTLSEEEFASRSLLVAAIAVKPGDFGLKTMSYTDALEFAGQPARLRYAIRFVNASGQKAAFSNFFLIEPASRVAAAPSSLTAIPSQDRIALAWTAPHANVDGTQPPNLLGYNIYRSTSQTEPAKLLNKTPAKDVNFDDRLFEFGKKYFYFVRAVSLGTESQPVESAESNIAVLEPKDTFAPSAPSALTLAATPTTISIFFASNPETDIAGYRIYRSTDAAKPRPDWELITKELLVTNTFQDHQVESGKTYFYYIIAVDKTGNISETSEVVSETVP
ncbi:MAG: fibronectin type III domain-containing protein [Pyrinomonadaceae bacterium]